MGEFLRGRENTKIVGKVKKLVEDRGEFIRSTRFGGVELKKGFLDLIGDIARVDVG